MATNDRAKCSSFIDYFNSIIFKSLLTRDKTYANRVVLGHDISKKNRLLAYGGTGYGHLLRTVKHQAREVCSIGDEQWVAMTVTTPGRLFSTSVQ